VKQVVEAMGAGLVGVAAVVIGAAIYVLHRVVIVPVHHAFLCLLLRVREWNVPTVDTRSPTRFLGEVIGLPFRTRIIAYTELRRAKYFPNAEDPSVIHAEDGLLVMTAAGMVVAAIYAIGAGKTSWPFWGLSLVFLVASYVPAWIQYSKECLFMKGNVAELRHILIEAGLLPAPANDVPPASSQQHECMEVTPSSSGA
jgi:hypothetical protein